MKKIIVVSACFIFLLALVSCSSCSSCVSCNKKAGLNEQITEKDPYEAIIEKYTELLKEKKSSDTELTVPDDANDTEKVLYDIVNSCADPSAMGYAKKDINRDGEDELVLMRKDCFVHALFTQKYGEPVLLLSQQSRMEILPDGTVYAYKFVPNTSSHIQLKKIVDGKLEGIEFGELIVETENRKDFPKYKIENGIRYDIEIKEHSYLYAVCESYISWNYKTDTKATGFRFIPALSEGIEHSNAPIADFSSYDAIIAGYRAIVNSFSEYTQLKWVNGDFDGLFRFNDNESYDAFHAIFYGGVKYMTKDENGGICNNAYGYAKKDIDGNGVEELILMTDNYDIIAVFTMKNGKAVLLDGLRGSMLDENGRFYVEREYWNGSLYLKEIYHTYEINGGALKCTFGLSREANTYFEKVICYKIDGNTEINISGDEAQRIYEQYNILPDEYSRNEYTRSFSGLEFVPIFGVTVATESHIGTCHNSQWMGGDELNVLAVGDGYAEFSMYFIHTVGDDLANMEYYETTISATAVCEGNRYFFETDGIKGYLEFAAGSVWVVVTESQNEHVLCKPYLLDDYRK